MQQSYIDTRFYRSKSQKLLALMVHPTPSTLNPNTKSNLGRASESTVSLKVKKKKKTQVRFFFSKRKPSAFALSVRSSQRNQSWMFSCSIFRRAFSISITTSPFMRTQNGMRSCIDNKYAFKIQKAQQKSKLRRRKLSKLN